MGNVDRILRAILAIVVAILFYQGIIAGTLGIVLIVGSVIFFLTSVVSFCPIYAIFGASTCKVKQ